MKGLALVLLLRSQHCSHNKCIIEKEKTWRSNVNVFAEIQNSYRGAAATEAYGVLGWRCVGSSDAWSRPRFLDFSAGIRRKRSSPLHEKAGHQINPYTDPFMHSSLSVCVYARAFVILLFCEKPCRCVTLELPSIVYPDRIKPCSDKCVL